MHAVHAQAGISKSHTWGRTPNFQNRDYEGRGDSTAHARGSARGRANEQPSNSAKITDGYTQMLPSSGASANVMRGQTHAHKRKAASIEHTLRRRPGAQMPDRPYKRSSRYGRCAGCPQGLMPLSSLCLRTACRGGIIIEGTLFFGQ